MSTARSRMPVAYLPHGGGPWPFVDLGFLPKAEIEDLGGFLRRVPSTLPHKPKALVVISAHWEERVPTVMSSAQPPMLYDYYGFPPASYRITWPAPGDPALAARVRGLLESAGFDTAEDPKRGYDHGTFVPLKVAFPEADVPVVQLSLIEGLDPQEHIDMGRALAPLRDDGVFVVGSGATFHNMRSFFEPHGAHARAARFDEWLQRAATADPATRVAELLRWASAPDARFAHPREEHIIPLHVIVGAAGDDAGVASWAGTFGGLRGSGYTYG